MFAQSQNSKAQLAASESFVKQIYLQLGHGTGAKMFARQTNYKRYSSEYGF